MATRLKELQDKYPDIEMGSYPFIHKDQHSTSLVLRSDKAQEVENAFLELKDLIKEYEIIT